MPGGALHTPAPRAKAGRMHSEGAGLLHCSQVGDEHATQSSGPVLWTLVIIPQPPCYGLCGRAFSSLFPTHCGVNGQVHQGC